MMTVECCSYEGISCVVLLETALHGFLSTLVPVMMAAPVISNAAVMPLIIL